MERLPLHGAVPRHTGFSRTPNLSRMGKQHGTATGAPVPVAAFADGGTAGSTPGAGTALHTTAPSHHSQDYAASLPGSAADPVGGAPHGGSDVGAGFDGGPRPDAFSLASSSLPEATAGGSGAGGGKSDGGFTIRVALDVGVRKVNLEVSFGATPPSSMQQLIRMFERTFVWDWEGTGILSPVNISHILLWGDLDNEWRYLCHHTDLAHGDQIYLFQKYQTRYTPGPLPPPRNRVTIGERVNFREPGCVRVAADLFGRKVNYELRYEQLPTTLDALRTECEKLLTCEALFVTPEGIRPADVVVENMLFWDEGTDRWGDLLSAKYISDSVQVYCHQREVVEVAGKMGPPEVVIPGGEMLVMLWKLFFATDADKRGYVTQEEVRHAFEHLGLQFPDESYEQMFASMDQGCDGRAHFSEFCQLGLLYPSIAKYLSMMADEHQTYFNRRANHMRVERDVKTQLHKARTREAELQRYASALESKRANEDDAQGAVLRAPAGASPASTARYARQRPHSHYPEPPPHPSSIEAQQQRAMGMEMESYHETEMLCQYPSYEERERMDTVHLPPKYVSQQMSYSGGHQPTSYRPSTERPFRNTAQQSGYY